MSEFMRLCSQALAVILGGPGIFYLWHSFYVPTDAFKAVIFLGAATIISWMLYPDIIDGERFAAFGRILVKIARRPPRR